MLPHTAREVGAHLPRDLANVVVNHTASRKRDAESSGFAGEGELMSRDAAFVRGAARAGHVALLRNACPSWTTMLHVGCAAGNMRTVQFAAARVSDALAWNTAFRIASRAGHADIARFAIERGATNFQHSFQTTFNEACKAGHADVAQLMIERGVTNVDFGLSAAFDGEHAGVVRKLIALGEPIAVRCFREACDSGYDEIANMILEQKAIDMDTAVDIACQENDLPILKMVIAHGGDPDEGLANACAHGYSEIVQFLTAKGATDLNRGLANACRNGHLEIAQFLTANGATDLNRGLKFACEGGHLEIIAFLVENAANDLDKGLEAARKHERLEVVEFLIEHGATNKNEACENNHDFLAQHLTRLGATRPKKQRQK